ncbi:hypothetical protein QFZ98_004829 [Paraburkholderia youngii]
MSEPRDFGHWVYAPLDGVLQTSGAWHLAYGPLARALLRLVLAVLPIGTLTMVLDDTLVMRCSKKAPGVAWRREHSCKTNRPKHVWAQCIVTPGVSVLGNEGVGMIQQSLAADAHRTRILDADSFVRMDFHAVAQPGGCRGLPHARNCAVENRSARHRWPGRPMAASGIYRTCLPHSHAAEVWKTPEARSASRPLSYQSMPLLRPRLLASSQSQSRSPSDRQRTATAFECLKLSLINKVFYGSKSKKTIGDMRARDHRGERS